MPATITFVSESVPKDGLTVCWLMSVIGAGKGAGVEPLHERLCARDGEVAADHRLSVR